MGKPRLACTMAIVAAVALSACGSPTAVAPSVPFAGGMKLTNQRAHRASWMKPGATTADLLYVSNGDGIVNVYRYWQHDLVGELIDFTQPEGECTDAHNNVYITDYGTGEISEYAHGGTQTLRVLKNSGGAPYACAVDPKTGNLAVANYDGSGYYSEGSVAVYQHAKGKPALYSNKYMFHVNGVAYDSYGDLLAAGSYSYSDYPIAYFAYLPAKSKDYALISLPPPYTSWFEVETYGVGWDGEYWTVDFSDGVVLYSINIKPQKIGSVTLSGDDGVVAFYSAKPKKRATQTVGTNPAQESYALFWKYPAGGNAYAKISHGLARPFGLVISLAK